MALSAEELPLAGSDLEDGSAFVASSRADDLLAVWSLELTVGVSKCLLVLLRLSAGLDCTARVSSAKQDSS